MLYCCFSPSAIPQARVKQVSCGACTANLYGSLEQLFDSCQRCNQIASEPSEWRGDLEERSGWKNRWQDQVAELKRRSMTKESDENLSWGARMRRKRAESSSE